MLSPGVVFSAEVADQLPRPAVYTHHLSNGGSSNGHYGGNAETYMKLGEAMGRAMSTF